MAEIAAILARIDRLQLVPGAGWLINFAPEPARGDAPDGDGAHRGSII
jgi:hypothetical protein